MRFASYIWTTTTFGDLQAVNPDGDPEMGNALVRTYVAIARQSAR
jgi:hypothetical protein